VHVKFVGKNRDSQEEIKIVSSSEKQKV
jgi:hypothetical protein